MGRKLDRHRQTVRMVLEPWLIEALARLGDRRLTVVEQRLVVAAAHTPSKVQCPEWGEVKP
jgi:hypothetical protein